MIAAFCRRLVFGAVRALSNAQLLAQSAVNTGTVMGVAPLPAAGLKLAM